ncbi:RagB/SusD family nutrient uptake outer membrane protein [Pedobacter sp. AW1-32]|uniref:RagB/SusD family nutrient uptake outer membrane protein n=1 Tax=Pedobacter sp. AW1-32 TaxID=3383026 RepID=UPI003FEF294B
MKKYIYLLVILSLILTFAACEKPKYETEPASLGLDYVFDPTDSLGTIAQQFLTDIYSYLPNGFNRINNNVLDAGTDDAISSQLSSTIEYFVNGRISSITTVNDSWNNNYEAIRKVNVFLANVDVVPLKAVGLKDYWKAEARLLRAFQYFELIKRYGGVPLIGDRILTINDNLELPRNSYQDCVNYVISECDALKPLLRPDPVSDADYGRLTQAVAMALKARLLLYDASPLNNPSNNLSKWANAAKAAKDLIDLNKFSLVANYLSVFTSRKNTEVILGYQRAVTYDVETNNSPVGYTGNVVSYGYTSPTQELVDAFEMKNGKQISDPTSGYLATDPYSNRDPRFYLTIFHNNMRWLNRLIQTYEGGLDKPGSSVVTQTRTGYYMRKFMADFSSSSAYSNQTHNFPIFRYAEILLNYAEAQNEAVGPDVSVYSAIQLIRQRAGLVPYTLNSGLTQSQMRDIIRHERRVEMAFEEQRYWDIRRWKIAENVLNGTLHGMQITRSATGVFSYLRYDALSVSFIAPKMYWYPISLTEISKNRNLTQNPGW